MSRSYKHFPVFGHVGCHSEKEYKTMMHRIERARVRTAIANGDYESTEVEMAPYNAWDAPCDGKSYWYNPGTPSMGWGVHNPETKRWSSKTCLKAYRKSLRK